MKIWLTALSNILLLENSWDKTGLLKGKNLLYHYTDDENLIKILNDNCLKISDTYGNLSFTRNSQYNIKASTFCLILDKNILIKHNIKTKIFSLHGKDELDENEEILLQDLPNLKKYLIAIGVSAHRGLSNTPYNKLTKKIIINNNQTLLNNFIFTDENIKDYLKALYFKNNYNEIYQEIYKLLPYNIPIISLYSGEQISLENLDQIIENSKESFSKSLDKYVIN